MDASESSFHPNPRLSTDWPIFGDCGTNVLENKDPQESQNLVISMDIVTVPCKFRKVALLRASLLGASMGTLLSTIFKEGNQVILSASS